MTRNVSEENNRSLSDDLIEGLLGGTLGYLVGEIANASYDSQSPKGKAAWNENRIMHHGDVGCLALVTGGAVESRFLVGLGAGLMLSDAKDVNDWVLLKNLSGQKNQ
jgi:hypothetical protein